MKHSGQIFLAKRPTLGSKLHHDGCKAFVVWCALAATTTPLVATRKIQAVWVDFIATQQNFSICTYPIHMYVHTILLFVVKFLPKKTSKNMTNYTVMNIRNVQQQFSFYLFCYFNFTINFHIFPTHTHINMYLLLLPNCWRSGQL